MKYNGVPVDTELMRERKSEADREMERVRRDIAFIIGDVDIGSNCSTNAFKKYLFKDLGLPVMKTTETDRAAADDAVMIQLKEWCDKSRPELSHLFELVQEYRRWNKITSTYITGYSKYINPVTGKIHPDFYSLSTDTGRFSCSRPNLQNAPRKTNDPVGVRNFIKAPEGHLIVSCDYSQIELRVGAFYCRDKTMMDTYKSGGDIHAATTSVIFGMSPTSRRRTRTLKITRNTARSPRTSTSARSTACSRADSRRPSGSRRGLINPSRSVKRSSET
jgi:DNA polymerase-1